jgi:hypothetical protein
MIQKNKTHHGFFLLIIFNSISIIKKQEAEVSLRKTKHQRGEAQGSGQVKCQKMCFVLLIKSNR